MQLMGIYIKNTIKENINTEGVMGRVNLMKETGFEHKYIYNIYIYTNISFLKSTFSTISVYILLIINVFTY